MNDDIALIADEAKSLAMNLYGARTRRLSTLTMDSRDDEVLQALQDSHDLLITIAHDLEVHAENGEPPVAEAKKAETETIPDEAIFLMARLDGLMEDHEVSVAQVSEDTGISRTTITNILKGKTTNPQTKTLRRLEEYFSLEEGALDG